MKQSLYTYLLQVGDNALILGHRLSELCGHGPTLETDIALTNISLDLFGQVRNYFQYAAKLAEVEKTEDDIAFLRYPHEYKNALLVEQPNTNFAHIIVRQFFFDAFHKITLAELCQSQDPQLAAIAQKSIKEVKYHYRFSSEWMKRLGAGTEESHQKMQEAVNILYPFVNELLSPNEIDQEMVSYGIGADLDSLKKPYFQDIETVLVAATLETPAEQWRPGGGKQGTHSEHLGYILADLQFMQRTYPNMQW